MKMLSGVALVLTAALAAASFATGVTAAPHGSGGMSRGGGTNHGGAIGHGYSGGHGGYGHRGGRGGGYGRYSSLYGFGFYPGYYSNYAYNDDDDDYYYRRYHLRHRYNR